jgi:glycosyltransferase involved in cell wall biosynthesis
VQSHADVEILVVDDCSTDKSVDIISQIAADDSRVHLLRAETNGGTYRARNLALTAASGEFVLAHDADDWAHPRKVERLVRHLMDHPESVAVRGRMIRLSESTGAHFRVSYVRPDFSSLTFRREAALRRAGYFDPVRAGADSEYAYRLQRIFGEESVADLKELLSVTSFAGESLSQGGLFSIDMDSGVFSPLRAAYQREYFRWHEHASTLFMSADDGPRPFPAPEEMIRRG